MSAAGTPEGDRPRAQWYRWGGVKGTVTEIARLKRNGFKEREDIQGNIYYVGEGGHIIRLYADGTWDSDKARSGWPLTDYFAWGRSFRAALRQARADGGLMSRSEEDLTEGESEALAQDVLVIPIKDQPGKFRVVVPNPVAYNLSPNYGALTEQEVLVLLCHKRLSRGKLTGSRRNLEECRGGIFEGGTSRSLFTERSMRRFGTCGRFLPRTTNSHACSVRTGWGGTTKVSFGCFVISMAARVRLVWDRRGHQVTGAALQWKS